jgi:hypothetical protein
MRRIRHYPPIRLTLDNLEEKETMQKKKPFIIEIKKSRRAASPVTAQSVANKLPIDRRPAGKIRLP